MAFFDLQAAREEEEDSDIALFLADKHNFDVEAAKAEGVTDSEIAEFLSQRDVPEAVPPVTPTPEDETLAPTPEEPVFEGQTEKGNIDLSNRPVVKNADGTVSTELSKSFNFDGVEVLIPTVVNGKIVSDEEAIGHFKETGEHLGKFDSVEAANAAAEQIHNRFQGQDEEGLTATLESVQSTLDSINNAAIDTVADTAKIGANLAIGAGNFILQGAWTMLRSMTLGLQDAQDNPQDPNAMIKGTKKGLDAIEEASELITLELDSKEANEVQQVISKGFEILFEPANKLADFMFDPEKHPEANKAFKSILPFGQIKLMSIAKAKGKEILENKKVLKETAEELQKAQKIAEEVEATGKVTPEQQKAIEELKFPETEIKGEIKVEEVKEEILPLKEKPEILPAQEVTPDISLEIKPERPPVEPAKPEVVKPAPVRDAETGRVEKPKGVSEVPIELPERLVLDDPIVTGVKKAEVERVREVEGRDPIPTPDKISNQETMDTARKKLESNPKAASELAEELIEKPRVVDAIEEALLDIEYMDLRKAKKDFQKQGELAGERGDGDAQAKAKRDYDNIEAKMATFERMDLATGRKLGQAFQFRQRLIKEDYSLENLERRSRAAKGFKPLTKEEGVQVKELHKNIEQAEVRIVERETRIRELETELSVKETTRDPDLNPVVLRQAENIVRQFEKAADSASKRLKEKLNRLAAGVDPTILADGAIVGSAKIARGTLEFSKWSAEMIKDFGGKIKPFLKDIWDRSNKLVNDRLKKTNPSVRKRIKDKTIEETIEENTKAIKRAFGRSSLESVSIQVQKLVKSLVAQSPNLRKGKIGREQLNPLVTKVQGILKESMPEITRLETMDAMSGAGIFKTLPQDAVSLATRDAKTQLRLIGHQQRVEAGIELKRSGIQFDPLSKQARQETQRLNELKRKFGVVVTDPKAQLASALQSSKTFYQNKIIDVKQEIATRERIVKTKTSVTPDAELVKLKAELAELNKQKQEIFGKRELSEKQRLTIATRAAEKNLVLWEQKLADALAERRTAPRASRKRIDANIEALKARTNSIKEDIKLYKGIKGQIVVEPTIAIEQPFPKAKKSPVEISLQATKTRTANTLAELKERVANEDFAKRPAKGRAEDAELMNLRAELEIVKDKFKAGEERLKWKELPVFRKITRAGVNAYDGGRLLMTTGEFSFILRQGKVFALSRPISTAKAIPSMLRALVSEKASKKAELSIFQHPEFAASQRAKVHISREGDRLSRQEEIVMGRWANAIPVVRNFNRAAVTFLNKLRFDSWLAMRKTLSKNGKPTLKEDTAIGTFVNEATGRGDLGRIGNQGAVAAGRLFFAPRYVISRVQLAIGHSLWGGTKRSRAVIAMEYGRYLTGLAIYYNMLMFGFRQITDDVELDFDPRSSDFGKIRFGKTRIDPLAGLAQLITLVGRGATGEVKQLSGNVYSIRGEVPYGKPSWWDLGFKFAAYKGHPIPVTTMNLIGGKDLIGKEATLLNQAGNLAAPITIVDIYKAFDEQDLPLATALSMLAYLGEGLQTFDPKTKKRRTKRTRTRRKGRD